MTVRIDETPDPDLDRVGEIAIGVAEKIREEDPRRLFDELTDLCRLHPAKAAQVMMTFAAWFDPEVPIQTLWRRVRLIAQTRTEQAVAV